MDVLSSLGMNHTVHTLMGGDQEEGDSAGGPKLCCGQALNCMVQGSCRPFRTHPLGLGGKTVSHKASFSSEDFEVINLFLCRVKELQNTKMLQGGLKLDFNFSGDLSFAQKDASIEQEEIIKSFITAFRHFYLDDEPTHFPGFHNRIVRRTQDVKAVEVLGSLRKRYKHVLNSSGGLAYYDRGQLVTPKKMIDLWFNAHYFHSDTAKRKELNDRLTRSGGLFQFLFLDALKELSAILIYYGKIVELIIQRTIG